MRHRRSSLGLVTLSSLACGGLFDRERDIPCEAVGGGSVTVRATGKFTWSDEVPGATADQLRAGATAPMDLEAREATLSTCEGRTVLVVQPGPTRWTWEGPEHQDGWLSLSLEPDGVLKGSLGMHVEYPGDSGWSVRGEGPPVDLTRPGSTTVEATWYRNGTTAVGSSTFEIRWALDPTVRHVWVRHYVPRRMP